MTLLTQFASQEPRQNRGGTKTFFESNEIRNLDDLRSKLNYENLPTIRHQVRETKGNILTYF